MLSQEYVHGPGIDNPWADLEHDGAGVLVRYYHADLLGSIRPITDGAGDVIQAYDLGAARPGIRLWRFAPTGRRPRFGETTECIFPFPFQPFQYAAREDDPDSKLDYNRARYYNPRAGRFISPDPLGAAGGRTNRFLYVGNSPTRFKDPSGLWYADYVNVLRFLSSHTPLATPRHIYTAPLSSTLDVDGVMLGNPSRTVIIDWRYEDILTGEEYTDMFVTIVHEILHRQNAYEGLDADLFQAIYPLGDELDPHAAVEVLARDIVALYFDEFLSFLESPEAMASPSEAPSRPFWMLLKGAYSGAPAASRRYGSPC